MGSGPRVNADSESAARLRVDLVTLFPALFESWLAQGVVSRAIERGIAEINLVPLRPFGVGRHQVTDDYPFGGGPGMVLKPEPLFGAIESLALPQDVPVILLSPRGKQLDQRMASRLAQHDHLVLVAGHYEGVDQRVIDQLITHELSVGDYVLSSGELAAMVVCDAVIRLLPGALAEGSAADESFSSGLLEYPQYTRPASFRGLDVPAVLLSGHHGEVEKWRHERALELTQRRRPDMEAGSDLTDDTQPK